MKSLAQLRRDMLEEEMPDAIRKKVEAFRTKTPKRNGKPQTLRDKVKQRKLLSKKTKKQKRIVRYEAYMQSKAWDIRRRAYFQKYGRACAICQQKNNLTLHHRHYRNLGNEEDADLVPLCWPHHTELHEHCGHDIKRADRFIQDQIESYQLQGFVRHF